MNVESVLDRILIKDSGAPLSILQFGRQSLADARSEYAYRDESVSAERSEREGDEGSFPVAASCALGSESRSCSESPLCSERGVEAAPRPHFQEPDLEFSVFCGTPSVHRKITMQISCGSRILGYCKATESEEIAALFRGEAEMLNDLHRKGIQDVPECLFCGDTDRKVTLFVQSTAKTSRSLVLHEWTELHTAFWRISTHVRGRGCLSSRAIIIGR